MKKLMSMLLAVAMVIGLIGPVIAVEETASTEPVVTVAEETVEEKTEETTESSEPVLSASAFVMEYYEGGYGAMPTRYNCSVETADGGYSEWFEISYGDPLVAEWPTEVGSHKVTFNVVQTVNGAEYLFTVPMNIDILPMPETSGQCGDNMYWKFDTSTDTLYIWGEGDMYTIAASREDMWEEYYLYEPGWYYLPVRHVVVEEGVENLSDFTFWQNWNNYHEIHETLQLPTTLQAIPEMGFVCSTAMESLTIPEGITSLTGWPFGSPGNSFTALKELHLPSTLKEMDITTVMLSGLDNKTAQQTLETIYFAGTQEQWDAIARVESESIKAIYGDDYEGFYENWCKPFQEVFEKVPVICTGTDDAGDEEFVAPEISIASTQLTASTSYASTVRDEYIDEETGEVTYSPEWTYYEWHKSSPVTITINGETFESTTLERLSGMIADGRYGQLSGGIIGNQSYENQWQVGGTYPVTYYIFRTEGDWETIWSVDLSVTLQEPPVAIEVSDIEVDELYGWMDGDYRYYDWQTGGRMTVTVDGTAYENVTYETLSETLEKAYGPVNVSLLSPEGIYENTNKLFEQSPENPWQVGDEMFGFLTIKSETDGTVLFAQNICVRVCETQIESVSIAPITYYEYESSGDVEITAHYKDGTSAVNNSLSYSYEGNWPKTAGTYTMNFTVAETFQVSVPVTVLPNPTSGNLGDTVTWVYDAETDTMTLSGSGKAVVESDRSWTKLLMQLAPQKVVVSEGIEYLEGGIFHYGLFIEELVLPTSLQEIPVAMIGFNGPTAGTYMEEEYGLLPGMTSITIPEGITSLTNHAFYLCWGITDFYLPSTLEEIDLDAICSVVKTREELGLAAAEITIHFAGTQAQWENVKHVMGATRQEYGSGMTDEQLEAIFATFTMEFAEEDVQYDPAVMDLSGDGKVTAFDAQILAEAKAGLRTLTEEQLAAIGALKPEDILNYILGN